jgi:hypothetical protein
MQKSQGLIRRMGTVMHQAQVLQPRPVGMTRFTGWARVALTPALPVLRLSVTRQAPAAAGATLLQSVTPREMAQMVTTMFSLGRRQALTFPAALMFTRATTRADPLSATRTSALDSRQGNMSVGTEMWRSATSLVQERRRHLRCR